MIPLTNIPRRAGALFEPGVITTECAPGQTLPLVISPAAEYLDLAEWSRRHPALLQMKLQERGAILFRGFGLDSIEEFQGVFQTIAGELVEYVNRSTPRTRVSGKVFTSTEYPAHQSIPLHNELSYSHEWPMKLAFFCVQAATRGGATPIADSRRVFERIRPSTRERFIRKRVMYVRNYGSGLDLSWQEVFQTDSRAEAERFCQRAGIAFEWTGPDHLTTRQVRPAIAAHPKTGELVWFNQAHLFHVSSLPVAVRELLLEEFGEGHLPRHAYYGDGSPIEPAALEEIREAYRLETVSSPWQSGDLLLLDNMLAAHGRESYEGPRRIVVAMAEPFSLGPR